MTRDFPEGLYVEGNKYLCELNLEENRLNHKKIQGHTTLKNRCSFHAAMISRLRQLCLFPKLSNY